MFRLITHKAISNEIIRQPDFQSLLYVVENLFVTD